jgi:flagellar biosynthetic protein FliP
VSSFIQFVQLLQAPLPLAFIALALLLLLSAFLKISLVFGFLRVGLGLDSLGGSFLTAGLALVLTYFIMSPTLEKSFGDLPSDCHEQNESCLILLTDSWKGYVAKTAGEEEKKKFMELLQKQNQQENDPGKSIKENSWQILAPAFVLSEVKKAFSIGIKILLPFLVIDLVIAYLFTALSITTLSAVTLSFPLKILAFTSLDGWSLVVENLLTTTMGG